MPVTFKIAAHESEPFDAKGVQLGVEHPADILKRSRIQYKDLIQSSLPKGELLNNFVPRANGFVQAIVKAYNGHHHLVIRPDDVWIAILSQFNLYVNANAEALRNKFVSHEGKETLIVEAVAFSRYHANYAWMAEEMTRELKKKIVDPELQSFIVAKFSTTTPVDTAIGCIMMMSTLKHYFDYQFHLTCGIPSITLLGTKEDYEDILRRIDKLDAFGDEPRAFAALLRPIIREFFEAFNDPSGGAPNPEFWGRICHYMKGSSGPDYISGWATAFCCWNSDGKWQGPNLKTFGNPVSEEERLESERYYKDHKMSKRGFRGPPALFLGDLRYPVVALSKVPSGVCEVDVLVNDNGTEYDCKMVAGHIGFTVLGERSDTLQPSPQWFLFEKIKE